MSVSVSVCPSTPAGAKPSHTVELPPKTAPLGPHVTARAAQPAGAVQLAPPRTFHVPALHEKEAVPVVGEPLSVSVTEPPEATDDAPALQVLPEAVHVRFAVGHGGGVQVAPGPAACHTPVTLHAKLALPTLPLLDASVVLLLASVAPAAAEQVTPPTVQLRVPPAQGAAMQLDAPDCTQLPFVHVKLAFPVLVLLEMTAFTALCSPAPTGAVQLTPGAPTQLTVPPLHGIGELLPPADGTQLGIGVSTDHRMPGGHAKPGLRLGLPSAARLGVVPPPTVCARAGADNMTSAAAASPPSKVFIRSMMLVR